MKAILTMLCCGALLLSTGCIEPLEDPDVGAPDFPQVLACGPSNCPDGCCFENICYKDKTENQCGTMGSACMACLGLNTCSQQRDQCTKDVKTKWAVQPISASITPYDPIDGLDWDADGSPPDVVVEVTCPIDGTQTIRSWTPEVSSLEPTWTAPGCTTTAEALLAVPTTIRVLDIDGLFDDEIARVEGLFLEEHFQRGVITLPASGGLDSLSIRLIRAQP